MNNIAIAIICIGLTVFMIESF